ncbi:MAG: hypothetical protein MZV64_43665 [Ignavibacteriales bacterium]|nr:hypothetical protein [Ignavibacteriales bacterium]
MFRKALEGPRQRRPRNEGERGGQWTRRRLTVVFGDELQDRRRVQGLRRQDRPARPRRRRRDGALALRLLPRLPGGLRRLLRPGLLHGSARLRRGPGRDHERPRRGEISKMIDKVTISLGLPAGFPEKYKFALVKAVDHCTVKAHILRAPQFEIVVKP